MRPWGARGWSVAPIGKLGSWRLLMLLSFALVTLVHPPELDGSALLLPLREKVAPKATDEG